MSSYQIQIFSYEYVHLLLLLLLKAIQFLVMVQKIYLEILLISFDNFILAEELFGKALQSFETCVS